MMKKIILLLKFCLVSGGFIMAQNALSGDIKVDVKNEQNINGNHLEYSPAFYENGIVFISDAKVNTKGGLLDNKIQKNTMSIFFSRRNEEGELGKPTPFAIEITTEWHEGPLTFNKTNDKIFFSRNNFLGGKTEKASSGIVKQRIISADMVNGQWTGQQELPFNDKEYDFVHPSINVDDDVLYFASDQPGGYGGMDIWKVSKTGNVWGTPVNLGEGVNSPANEVFPFIHADGTLFFSSNGHDAIGGGDIFFTKEYRGQFVTPVNLGPRFNTASDDFGFIIDRDKRNGYYSSNRSGGEGQDDIYSFFIDEPLGEDIFKFPDNHPAVIASNGAINNSGMEDSGRPGGTFEGSGFGNRTVTLFVADRLTGRELNEAVVEYVDLEQLANTEVVTDQNGQIIQLVSSENGEVVTLSTEENVVSGITDSEGAFNLKIGEGNYLVNISRTGYQPRQILVSAADQREEFMVLMDKVDNCVPVLGLVVNNSGNPIPGTSISLQEVTDPIPQGITADAGGNFNLCLECGKTYVVQAEKNGQSTSREITIPADCYNGQPQQLTLNLEGSSFADGTTIRLERIYYNFNDASIRPDARDELNTLVSILNAYPELQIEIASHTDSRGGDSYNRQLSQRRADKVMAYLVRQGIDASRLTPVGYGESDLLNNCSDGVSCTELEHQYNRRTEIRIKGTPPVRVINELNEPETVDPARFVSNSRRSGKYQVIAGSFSIRNNATNRLSRIQQLGFDQAKLIIGSGIARNVVLVASFSSYSQARQLADEIENVHNINTYVKRN